MQILLLLGIGFLLHQKYQEIKPEQLTIQSLVTKSRFVIGIGLALVLTIVNYTIEIEKWKGLLHLPSHGFWHHTKAFLSGSAISLFMPFRSGEYLGRILYFEQKNWSRVIISSMRAGLLQLLVTLIIGMICSVFAIPVLEKLLSLNIYSAFAIGVVGIILIVLAIRLLPIWVRSLLKRINLQSNARDDSRQFAKPFSLSVLRYGVFVLQYAILLWACQIADLQEAVVIIPVFLLVQTIVPTFFLSEIGLRLVLASYFFDSALVIVPISIIYFINILLPALLGVFFLKKWKS